MKHFITYIMLSAVLSLTAIGSYAQERVHRRAPQQSMRRQYAPKQNPDSLFILRVARMAERYNLSTEQQAAVKELLKSRYVERHPNNQRPDFRNLTKEQRDSIRAVFEKNQQSFNEELKKILNEEQYNKYLEDRVSQANRQKRQGQHQRRRPYNHRNAQRD